MRIQVFSEYLQLAQAGKLKFLACPMHQEDEPSVFPLVHKQESDDSIVLECLACTYKVHPGLIMYNKILEDIRAVKSELEKMEGSL